MFSPAEPHYELLLMKWGLMRGSHGQYIDSRYYRRLSDVFSVKKSLCTFLHLRISSLASSVLKTIRSVVFCFDKHCGIQPVQRSTGSVTFNQDVDPSKWWNAIVVIPMLGLDSPGCGHRIVRTHSRPVSCCLHTWEMHSVARRLVFVFNWRLKSDCKIFSWTEINGHVAL